MRWTAILLTLIAFLRHAGDGPVAQIFSIPVKAAQYILGGFQETFLWIVIAILLWFFKDAIWRKLAWGACAIGIVEGIQIPVCRILAFGKQKAADGVNLCDHVSGMPASITLLTMYTLAVSLFFRRQDLTKWQYRIKGVICFVSCWEIAYYLQRPTGLVVALILFAVCLAI